MSDGVVLGIDIGSSHVTVAAGGLASDGQLEVLGLGKSVSAGLQRGNVVDDHDLCQSVDRAIQRATHRLSNRPTQALMVIPSSHISFKTVSSIVVPNHEDGLISASDQLDVLQKSKLVLKSPDQTVLHLEPLRYLVDGEPVDDPVGVAGTHLELESMAVFASSAQIEKLRQVVKLLGLELLSFVYAPLSYAQVALRSEELLGDTVLFEVGGRFSTTTVFRGGAMVFSHVVPLGGDTITSDIATCLNVKVPEAERLKVLYGELDFRRIDDDKKLLITTSQGERQQISPMLLSQVIEARFREIIALLSKPVKDLGLVSPSYVLGGGGSQFSSLGWYMEHQLHMPCRYGFNELGVGVVPKMVFASCVGVLQFGARQKLILPSLEAPKTSGTKLGSLFSIFKGKR